MKYQKKYFFLILLSLISGKCTFSQLVINSSGFSIQNNSVSLEYSIGEISIESLLGNNQHFTQGLLQPIIKITNCSLLNLLPTAFTPNNDGKNDCFGVKNWPTSSSFELLIYNRWGTQVYKSNKLSDCWDGNFNSRPQPIGAYVYFLRAVNSVCGNISAQGTIMLIR